jgi:hypothetical protein
VSEFRRAWLHATSEQDDDPTQLIAGHFDLLVTTASWDSRCLCLIDCEVTADSAVGVFFTNRGEGTLRDKHDPQVQSFLERAGSQVTSIHRGSDELDDLWGDLWNAITDAADVARSPLRVLLDLSTCPRYFAMALIAAGFRSHLVGELIVFYAEGKYPPPTDEDPHEPFTHGRWETVPVPLLEGQADPGLPRHYVVSVGFEGSKTVRAVSSEGADNVTVLFPRPGVAREYEKRTMDENRILLDDFGIDEDEVIAAPAGDSVATWRALDERRHLWTCDDAFYLPAGTKPHAIGMALDAMLGGDVSVMYAKPATHKETAIEPLGHYWRFTIRDLTSRGNGR